MKKIGIIFALKEELNETKKMFKNIVEHNIYDLFISDEQMGAKINKKYDALCVEMEGASVAQVCYLCKVPFLVVRAISDSPYEKDNHITFEEFLKISSDMVSKFIVQLLEKIYKIER